MRWGFRSSRDAALAGMEAEALRRIPALPPDWIQPPADPGLTAVRDAVLEPPLDLALRSPARAEECGRWKRSKAHDPHTWDHRDHGLVACPGYRPLT